LSEIVSIFNGLGNQRMEDIGIWAFLVAILYSLLCAFIFSYLYSFFFEKRATGSQINRAFPLLSIAITVIFITVQFSLPLSLGLLGALSIVRFRTPVKEPEEIGFIMLVIASSLSCATFNFVFPLILALVACGALLIIDRVAPLGSKKIYGGMLVVIGPKNANADQTLDRIEKELAAILPTLTLHSMSCAAETLTCTYAFNKVNNEKVSSVVSGLLHSYPDFQFNLMTNRSSVL
jgi:hypothetical protein